MFLYSILSVIIVVICLGRGSPITPSILDDIIPCHNKEVIRYAKSAEIRNYLNESGGPCGNFYNFACGNYDRINPPEAPPYQKNIFQSIAKTLGHRLLNLLQVEDETLDTLADKKVKSFFDSCSNIESLRESYRGKLQEIINEFGKMPALEGAQWQESEFDWLKTAAEIAHKYNIHMIMGYFVDTDNSNKSINRMAITAQDIPLHSSAIYREDIHAPVRAIRKNAMAQRLREFLELETDVANQTVEEIFQFETHLIVGYNNSETIWDFSAKNQSENSKISSNLISIEEIQNKYSPHLDIKRWLNISLGSLPSEPIYDYLEDAASNIVMALKRTPKRIVANYLFYNLLENFMFAIPKDRSVLQDWCVTTTKSHFAKNLDNMIYRNYVTPQTVKDVDYLWQTIKKTFHNMLETDEHLPWMSQKTRRNAVEKLLNIRLEINAYQHTNFSEELADLHMNSVDYIENIKALLIQSARKWRAKVNAPPKSYDNPVFLSFTPVYIQNENLIKVPVSILQPYFMWSDHYPNALKFATLGFLISHELLHAFDEDGRLFDKSGILNEWFDTNSNEYFDKQRTCFSLQYHKYLYNERPLPKLKAQAENTADNGGLRLAYLAYLRWYENAVRSYEIHMSKESLPRLEYTNKQLFFIAYGQLWCSNTHPLLRSYTASTDEHVPNEFRAIVPLSNMAEFSQEFNCPLGSDMNPENKCVIY